MGQHTSFSCSICNERIEDPSTTSRYEGDCPVIVYMVAGVAPLHPLTEAGADGALADVTNFPMPQIVRDLLAQPVARMDFCPECLAERLGLPMVDQDGKEVKPRPVASGPVKA